MIDHSSRPLRHGIVLVAGGAVGAGMFALPIVSAGVGFIWAALGLVLVWLVTYQASVMLLAANLDFPTGASFNTVVKVKLGRAWANANNLSIAFIMYVLMYAYTTAGASILSYTISPFLATAEQPSREALSLLFILAVGILVWVGSTSVSRISFLCLIAMAILLTLVVTNLFGLVTYARLDSTMSQIAFGGMVLPVFVTAFACGGLVPSLVKHYGSDAVKVKKCLLYGTLLSLAIYLFWVASTLGVLSQAALIQIIAAGGNMGDLVAGLLAIGANETLQKSLTIFSHLAIITSFLSVGLGLFDFVLDYLGAVSKEKSKVLAALLSFGPPAILSMWFPYGFVTAIGYAGLAVCFSFFLVPAVLVRKASLAKLPTPTQINSRWAVFTVLGFALLVTALKVLTVLKLLPTFP